MRQQILIIDDSRPIHALVTALLAEEAVDVHSATDAAYGLVLAASLRPDLILLDVDMPGMNGFDACRSAKADRATAGVPIIFLTSLATTEEKVRGLELGAMDYVTKPFNRAELWARVRAALRTSQAVGALEGNALLDPLTGLGNRAMFERQLAAEVSRRGKLAAPLSCILVDVDCVAAINSAYGQACGDRVLQQVAGLVAGVCRPEEAACRYGGKEFAVIAPLASAEDALGLADRIRDAIGRAEFAHQGNRLRVSPRFAVADASDLYDRSMVTRAEEALALAQQQEMAARPSPAARAAAA